MQVNQDQVLLTPLRFASSDETSTIHACVWSSSALPGDVGPRLAPRGVIQVVHGMCEHKERYDEFARALVHAGFVVCAHDQIGHGQSCAPERWGCLPAHGGRDILVEDVHRLRALMTSHLRKGTPYIVFGHSMGSFVTRAYISQHAGGLAGAIICGTGSVDVSVSRAGNALARAIARLRGQRHKSKLLRGMADGGYASTIPNARTEFDWLSRNQENVDRYIADEACGFAFSAGGYATLTELTAEVCDLKCAQRVPADLPLYYIAGGEDAVGGMGVGVEQAAELATRAGSRDVSCKIYARMRHEILNEDGRAQVFADVIAWAARRCSLAQATPAAEA